MKYPKKFEEAIRKCTHELKGDLYHGEWKFLYYFEDEEKDKDGSRVFAEIDTDPIYLQAKIRFYPIAYEMWEEKDYNDLLRSILHEVCHLLTEPLYRFCNDYISEIESRHLNQIRERQTQRIANIAYHAIDVNKYLKILKK